MLSSVADPFDLVANLLLGRETTDAVHDLCMPEEVIPGEILESLWVPANKPKTRACQIEEHEKLVT